MSDSKVKIILELLGDKSVQRSLMQIRTRFMALHDAVFSLRGVLAAAGGGLLAKQFLDASRETEQLQVRLQVLLGSVREGSRLFEDMAEYASKVPFELEEINESATMLAGVMNPELIKQWMPLIGDLAAASKLSIVESTEQVMRMYSAGAAAADKFRDRGILAMLGFKAGVSYTAEETREKLMEAWTKTDSQFRGATDKLAGTWDGTMSMMSDKWFKFRSDVMEAGPFEYLKAMFQLLNEHLDENGEKVGDLAKSIGEGIVEITEQIALGTAGMVDKVGPLVSFLVGVLEDMWGSYRNLPPWAQELGMIGAILGGPKGALVVGGLAKVGDAIRTSAEGLALVTTGEMSLKDWVNADAEEMKAMVEAKKKEYDALLGPEENKGRSLFDLIPGDRTNTRERVESFFDAVRKRVEELRDSAKDMGEAIEAGLGGAGGDTEGYLKTLEKAVKAEKVLIRDRIEGMKEWHDSAVAAYEDATKKADEYFKRAASLNELIARGRKFLAGEANKGKSPEARMRAERKNVEDLISAAWRSDDATAIAEAMSGIEEFMDRYQGTSDFLGFERSFSGMKDEYEGLVDKLERLRDQAERNGEAWQAFAEEQQSAAEAVAAEIETLKADLETLDDYLQKELKIDASGALKATDEVRAAIDSIPDETVKTVIIKYMTEASPVRPFGEGIAEIKRKMESLPTESRHTVKYGFGGSSGSGAGGTVINAPISVIAGNRSGAELAHEIERELVRRKNEGRSAL